MLGKPIKLSLHEVPLLSLFELFKAGRVEDQKAVFLFANPLEQLVRHQHHRTLRHQRSKHSIQLESRRDLPDNTIA